jgi:hypothetical protein
MDSLVGALLVALQMSLARNSPSAPLLAPPLHDLLSTMLAGSPWEQQVAQLAPVVDATMGQAGLATRVQHLADMLRREHAPEWEQPHLARHWDAVYSALNDVAMVSAILTSSLAPRAALRIVQPALFRYIQVLRLNSQTGGPITLVARVPEDMELPIRLDTSHALLKRIEIVYHAASPYPALTLRLPSTTRTSPWEGTRQGWQQRALPEYDLQLYNFNQRPLGRIMTRLVRPPSTLECERLTLVLEAENIDLLRTDVVNDQDELLATCIRVAPPVDSASAISPVTVPEQE